MYICISMFACINLCSELLPRSGHIDTLIARSPYSPLFDNCQSPA